MKSIYMASKLVACGGFVFVHDCDRLVEQQYVAQYLGPAGSSLASRGMRSCRDMLSDAAIVMQREVHFSV